MFKSNKEGTRKVCLVIIQQYIFVEKGPCAGTALAAFVARSPCLQGVSILRRLLEELYFRALAIRSLECSGFRGMWQIFKSGEYTLTVPTFED